MENKRVSTKIIAIVGTLLAWLPILTPVLFSLILYTREGRLRFDYLMPAELFPAILVGGGLLFWAARRARTRSKVIGWSLGAAVCLLIGSQATAVFTGLASGAIEPAGPWWALVLTMLCGYILALIVIDVNGGLLLRDLFKP